MFTFGMCVSSKLIILETVDQMQSSKEMTILRLFSDLFAVIRDKHYIIERNRFLFLTMHQRVTVDFGVDLNRQLDVFHFLSIKILIRLNIWKRDR